MNNGHQIGILSYNVNGLNTKLCQDGFLAFLKSYEILILLETFLEEDKCNRLDTYFQEYEVAWVPAVRLAQRGRASGGCMLAYKKSLGRLCSFLMLGNTRVMRLILDKSYCGTIIPVYLNGSNWDADLDSLKATIELAKLRNLILMGDFNARIGAKQEVPQEVLNTCWESSRRSRDSVGDHKGELLIDWCNKNDIVILNGRSTSDSEGNHTYIGYNGSTVFSGGI